ncbi:hypothetical protein ACSFA3_03605 [Variovorax sp. RHLX14]
MAISIQLPEVIAARLATLAVRIGCSSNELASEAVVAKIDGLESLYLTQSHSAGFGDEYSITGSAHKQKGFDG